MTRATRGMWVLTLVAGCSATVADPPSMHPLDEVPRVVCRGFADIEGGLAALRPEQSGRVVAISCREGQDVKSGDVLLRLDDASARQEVAVAGANVESALAKLAQAEQEAKQHPARLTQRRATLAAMASRLAGSRVTLKRQEELFDKRLAGQADVDVSREQVRELESAVESARAQLTELSGIDPRLPARSAVAEVEAAKARRAQAENGLTRCLVKAPSAGAVAAIGLRVGEIAGPAGPGAIEFRPEGAWLVRTEVEQDLAAEIQPGQPVRVRDESAGAGPWKGHVERVGQVYQRRRTPPDPTQFTDVPTVEVLIRLDAGHPPLRIGQRLRVSVYGAVGEVR